MKGSYITALARSPELLSSTCWFPERRTYVQEGTKIHSERSPHFVYSLPFVLFMWQFGVLLRLDVVLCQLKKYTLDSEPHTRFTKAPRPTLRLLSRSYRPLQFKSGTNSGILNLTSNFKNLAESPSKAGISNNPHMGRVHMALLSFIQVATVASTTEVRWN